MGKAAKADSKIHELTEGAWLFSSPQGNILFGCPPEILKRILASHLPMPDTVVVSEKLHHLHSSQASLEFPLYHFLFVQRGLDRNRRFQIVATPLQCRGIEDLLRVTVVGPTDKEMIKSGTAKELAEEIFQETVHLSLKNPNTGKPFAIKEMINFHPLKDGEQCVLYPLRGQLAEIRLERRGPAKFRVLYGEEAYEIDLSVTHEQAPNYKINKKPFDKSRNKFKLVILGRSNGFDPNDPANGYLLNIDGKIVLWDCPAYLHQHLKKLKVNPKEIDAFILSHVHEDHIDVSESLRDPPFELYATHEVYYSLLVKLSAVYGCSLDEAKKYHNWHPIEPDKPTELCGATFTFFHSVHAIPAIGCRIAKNINGKRGLLHISGDYLALSALNHMQQNGGISEQRYRKMTTLLTGEETLILMDAGGGTIHGDYRDYIETEGRVAFMHTGFIQEKLPKGKHLVSSGEVLDILE